MFASSMTKMMFSQVYSLLDVY